MGGAIGEGPEGAFRAATFPPVPGNYIRGVGRCGEVVDYEVAGSRPILSLTAFRSRCLQLR
jgi:hypothetical protein